MLRRQIVEVEVERIIDETQTECLQQYEVDKEVLSVSSKTCQSKCFPENGGADGTRTRDPRRDRPVF